VDQRRDEPIGVLVVDDHEMVAHAIADVLRAEGGFRIVDIVASRRDALRSIDDHRPDVVLLDLRLGDDDMTTAIADLLTRSPSSRILVLSAWADEWSVSRAVEGGCHGYLLKEQGLDDLVQGVRDIARGDAVFAPAVLSRVLKLLRPGSSSGETLTAREVEVLQRLADGLTTEQIAADLYVSVNTVRNHVNNIIRKLNVHSRLEAVSVAIRQGLIRVG
jgi:DNA-binding NarL/FixJ family response regulator